MIRQDLRNIAIIAHIDHGKTTLVDQMLRQCGAFRENQVVAERFMDSGDIERERGITILAKNTAVDYKGVRINIVDTPGHADFSGEVERVLKMVDGVLLLVDSFEGTMPQTRFVLQKALEAGHKIIVVVNKIDRPGARSYEVVDEVLELLLDLDASEEQLLSPVVFCSGRSGTSGLSPEAVSDTLEPLFQAIVEHIPAPQGDETGAMQLLVSSIDYSEYLGRIAIGKVERGQISASQEVAVCNYHYPDSVRKGKIAGLFSIGAQGREAAETAQVGDIVCVSGIEGINIGDTICAPDSPEPVAFSKISEPTIEMTFSVNDSPFAGREGKFVTSRHLRDRLYRETLRDVSLRVTDGDSSENFRVAGRGEMHLSILIETMRREGYEFQVSTPRVLMKEENGETLEPMERVVIDVPDESMGNVMEKLGQRKAELLLMEPRGSRMRLEFSIPSRGLLGYRNEFLTDTRGEGVLNAVFDDFAPYKGDIAHRSVGSLIAFEAGEAVTYGLYNAQERGSLFIGPSTPVYEGMIVGQSAKSDDIAVNVCKKKHVTNMRASGSDDALRLTTPRRMSIEQALEFITDDELIEITPKSLRLRKRILNNQARMRAASKK